MHLIVSLSRALRCPQPAVSYANLGQLTLDLLINTLLANGDALVRHALLLLLLLCSSLTAAALDALQHAPVTKVGHFVSENVPPIAGSAAFSSQARDALCLNLEGAPVCQSFAVSQCVCAHSLDRPAIVSVPAPVAQDHDRPAARRCVPSTSPSPPTLDHTLPSAATDARYYCEQGRAKAFAQELVDWAKRSNVASLCVVSGTDDMLRHDPNMRRCVLRAQSPGDWSQTHSTAAACVVTVVRSA